MARVGARKESEAVLNWNKPNLGILPSGDNRTTHGVRALDTAGWKLHGKFSEYDWLHYLGSLVDRKPPNYQSSE